MIALDTPLDPAEHRRHHLRHRQRAGRQAHRPVRRRQRSTASRPSSPCSTCSTTRSSPWTSTGTTASSRAWASTPAARRQNGQGSEDRQVHRRQGRHVPDRLPPADPGRHRRRPHRDGAVPVGELRTSTSSTAINEPAGEGAYARAEGRGQGEEAFVVYHRRQLPGHAGRQERRCSPRTPSQYPGKMAQLGVELRGQDRRRAEASPRTSGKDVLRHRHQAGHRQARCAGSSQPARPPTRHRRRCWGTAASSRRVRHSR